jgi:molybdopterin synthase catalytic subunit
MSKSIFQQGAISSAFIGESIAKHQSKTSIGAHQLFLGQVRADVKENDSVKSINYTAYEEMANAQMAVIREETFEKHDITCMHVYHSLGNVEIGEICLFVFVSSPHRKASQIACNELVERIKNELPIWGQEVLSEGLDWKVNQ